MSIDLSSSVSRISGMSSGLDTESIVTSMLSVEQSRIDKQFQLQTTLEWKADAYREINLQIKNFREKYLSVLNADSNMLSKSVYNINEVTMLNTTNAVTISASSSAQSGNLTINSITQLAEAAQMSSSNAFIGETMNTNATLADLELTNALVFEAGEISFSINGETFTFSESTSIGDMMNTINSNSNAGVRISYSSLTQGFTIKSISTGSESEVALVNITGNAFSDTDSAFGISQGTVNGQDAILSIEGIEVVRSINSFTIDGISYSLKNELSTSVSFNIDRNVEETIDKISEFINAYNELIADLQDTIDEETHRTYKPLTDDERASLSEKEIEKWEDLAKSGILRNDSYVSSLLNTMRSAFFTEVGDIGKNMASIGLGTSSYYDKGQITIDKDILRSALENNPEEVISMFTSTSASEDNTEKYNGSGLVTRISNSMLDYTNLTVSGSIASLGKQISEAEDRMERLEERFATKEESLWARFTAMETALATLNSQSSWLSSLFSSNE